MKKIFQIVCILILCLQINCEKNSTDETDPPPVDKEYTAIMEKFWFEIAGVRYPKEDLNLWIEIPYNEPFIQTAYFQLSEGAKAYVNDVEQVSGTVNDFTNPVDYKIVSYDGLQEKTYTIEVTWAENRESRLYWMKVTAESVTYDCDVDEDSKTVTLNVPSGTDLSPVILEFKVSDNANLIHVSTILNGGYANFESDTNNIIKIKAENGLYYTDYTLIKTFY